MSEYSNKLKHPNWQKKRLKILERDNFKCQSCFSKNKELIVHHLIYDYSIKSPWNYPDETLITLCKDCHNSIHSTKIALNAIRLSNLICNLADEDISFINFILIDIEFKMSIEGMTRKEATKISILEYLKHR